MAKELSVQIAKYDSLRDSLETDYTGKWLLMYDEEIVDFYDSFESAAKVAIERFGSGPYLIRQVGAPTATEPPSLMFRPLYARD